MKKPEITVSEPDVKYIKKITPQKEAFKNAKAAKGQGLKKLGVACIPVDGD